VAAHVVLFVWMCVRVYMRITCVCAYLCMFITYLRIDTDTHNTHKQHLCEETPVYITIHTYTRKSGHSCRLSVWMQVSVYMSVMVCVYVYACIHIYVTHLVMSALMCVRVHMCITARVKVFMYLYHTFAHCRRHMQYTWTTYMQRNTCVLLPQFITWTHMRGRSCCLVYMDVCTCVYVYHNVYVYVCIYIILLHIDVTAVCTIHVHNVHEKKQMCTYTCKCTTIHTHTCMSGRSCSLAVWMVVRVYMYVTHVRLCVCVYVYLYHTCTHWHRHEYTQYMWTTYIQRDTCVLVPSFIQSHSWVLM